MNLFEKCLDVVLKHEGGYVNHPDDPGGETNMGIAKRFYPDEDIKFMNRRRAMDIYYKDYWRPLHLEGILDHLAVLHIFDMAVNAGRSRAAKMAQALAGVAEDGIIGPVTTRAINEMGDAFVPGYIKARKAYYRDLAKRKKNLKVFLKGWLNRVDNTCF